MRDIPDSVLLSWPTPNYINPPTRGHALTIINVVLLSLATVIVGLRFYTRIAIRNVFGWDDAFIGLALLFSAGLMTAVLLGDTLYGWNKHVWDIALTTVRPALKLVFAAKILFALAAMFTKLSLLCFYNRLVANSGIPYFNFLIQVCHAFVVLLGTTFIGLTIWGCRPVDEYWVYPPAPSWKSHCINEGLVVVSAGAINCFADFLITVLPIPLVMRLQMPLRRRIGVLILLSLGMVVTVAGIVRTYYAWDDLMNTYDVSWASYPLWIAATVEVDLAVICTCLPQMRPLVLIWYHKLHERDLWCCISNRLPKGVSNLRYPDRSSREKTCSCGQFAESTITGSAARTSTQSGKNLKNSFTELNMLEHGH